MSEHAAPDSQAHEANRALLFVSLAVLLATSTWFSGTAATPLLQKTWHLSLAQSAWLTISVQLGFIVGTLLYALFNLADVFNARRVFFVSAVLGALFNAGFAMLTGGLPSALTFRFLTGITLAGIYPVGMKIVASWFQSGLGWRLGVMVGALTLGTASPYLIQTFGSLVGWRGLVASASLFTLLGGALMLAYVKDGPYLRQRATFNVRMMFKVFEHRPFRLTALGYFGHMWELYAFWSLLAFYLKASLQGQQAWLSSLPLVVFAVISTGALGCALGGWFSQSLGERRVALLSLLVSSGMCLISGFVFALPAGALLPLLLLWGFFVVSDSPQFSALAARHAPPEYTGTALNVQNGLGFAVTVVSIQLLPWLAGGVGWRWSFTFLALGPLLGAYFMRALGKVEPG